MVLVLPLPGAFRSGWSCYRSKDRRRRERGARAAVAVLDRRNRPRAGCGDRCGGDRIESSAAPAETARAKPAPIQIANFRPHDARGLNVFEAPKQEGVPYRASRSNGAPRSRSSSRRSSTRTRHAERRGQRRSELADRHRLGLQQCRREPLHGRPARPRHPRRADQLSLLAPSLGNLGEGRLPADRRFAVGEPAARRPHEVPDAAARALRDQLRRHALPPHRQRPGDVQSARRQPADGRLHHRDRRRGLSAGARLPRDGAR